jgi:hypothetical protein
VRQAKYASGRWSLKGHFSNPINYAFTYAPVLVFKQAQSSRSFLLLLFPGQLFSIWFVASKVYNLGKINLQI